MQIEGFTNMEIRDPIYGTIELSKADVKILDSVIYQRLRFIKQLGFAEFSFPGATHNRFLHSVGVSHVAGLIFDSIFKNFQFSSVSTKLRLKNSVRLAAMLHDIGHGPLSHTTEEVMPMLSELKVDAYKNRRTDIDFGVDFSTEDRQANHEDYTIKFITDSPLAEQIRLAYPDISPLHIACLIDKTLVCPDDFFVEQKLNFRNILSQIVSSEMDADRLDYLERDAYFCGANYGRVEMPWLVANMSYHINEKDELNLALNRRALYAFDDFLLARHHMHLMIYFHHKAIIYEELLHKYLLSEDCQFKLPADINEYSKCTDFTLYEHLKEVDNEWAQRISQRKPYRMLFELHSTKETERPTKMKEALEEQGVHTILASSMARLSKYHSGSPWEKAFSIFVVDQYDRLAKPYPIEQTTEIFQKYEEIRRIERLYVSPENFEKAEKFMIQQKL